MTRDFTSFVLAGSTDNLALEPEARKHADMIEFRMDLAANPEQALTDYDGKLPIIATNRVSHEGGNAKPTPTRLAQLTEASEYEFVTAIDIELSEIRDGNATQVVENAHHTNTDVIVSTHNFNQTPPTTKLRESLEAATNYGTVGKLAVTAKTPRDVLRLLDTTWEFASADTRIATMAMGKIGQHSRLIAPIYGSKIGYAPIDPNNTTAPGQFDLTTFRKLLDAIGIH